MAATVEVEEEEEEEMVESFCNSYYIPDEVHPTAPGRDRTITQFPEGKVGVYTRCLSFVFYFATMGVIVLYQTADPRRFYKRRSSKREEQWASGVVVRFLFVLRKEMLLKRRSSGGCFLNPNRPECDVTMAEKQMLLRGSRRGQEKEVGSRLASLSAVHSRRLPYSRGFFSKRISPPMFPHADAPVYTAADIVTSSRGKTLVLPTSDVGGSSQPETSEESTDSFYETTILNSEDAKRWSRTEHELELKEKLRGKYDARGVLLREKDAEIARLKSLLEEKETESAEVPRLRDQVSVLAADKSLLSAEVSALKNVVSQKDTDISLLDSRASYLKSALDDSQAACGEARSLISSLSSERDGLASEVSTLHSTFRDFKEKMEAQQEEQAQELYNRVAELEAHVMDVSGRLEGEFYPAYLTALAGRRWLLTHGMELAMVKSAGHEHGIAGTPLSAVVAYDPETAKNNYFDAVRALEEADFPLIHLLKSKKDSGMDEVLDCFLLDGPLANLPEAAYLQPCLEQLSVPIYYANVNAVVGETSLSLRFYVHKRAEGARKHAVALRQLMVDIVSHPLSSQNLLGEASTSAVAFCVDDLDTDEDLGSVVCMPHLEDPRFEILP
ncbi:hypothetical protein Tco_0431346 [Tanacetum coccineum]